MGGVERGAIQAKDLESERFRLNFTIACGTKASTCLLRCLPRRSKVFPGLAAARKWTHMACSHCENEFVGKNKQHAGRSFLIHTGTTDACWGRFKKQIPS